jgi:hypothetical protein
MPQTSVFSKTSVTDFFGQPATPANPPANQARMFYRSDNDTFHVIDSTGTDLLSSGGAPLNSPAFTGTPTAPTAALGTNTTQLATTAFVLANAGSTQVPVVLSGGADAIDPHTSATYIVNSAGVDSMTIVAPTVTTDDGKIIKFTTNTAPSHTLTFTGGHLRSGVAGVTTATFSAAAGSSLQIMAYQGNWYAIAQNNIASYT